MITDKMQVLTGSELIKALGIDQEDLLELEEAGLPFTQLPGEKRAYLTSSLKEYLKRVEIKKRAGSTANPGPRRKVNE